MDSFFFFLDVLTFSSQENEIAAAKFFFSPETVWESVPLKVCINYIIFSLILKHTPLIIRCIKIQCLQKQRHGFQMTIIPGNLDYMEFVVFRCIV